MTENERSSNGHFSRQDDESQRKYKLHGTGVPIMNDESRDSPYDDTRERLKGFTRLSDPETQSRNPKASLFKKSEDEDLFTHYDFRKLLLGLQRHFLLILISALLFTGLGAYLTYYLATTYQAETVLLYQEEGPKGVNETQPLIFFSLPTLIDMVKLPAHLQAVKSILGLELTTEEIGKMVSVPVPKDRSNFFRIIAKSSNPALAVDVANTLSKIAVKSSQEFYLKQLTAQHEVLNGQYERLKQKQQLQAQEIESFKQEQKYYDVDPTQSSVLSEIANARSQLLNATLQYNTMLIEYENLKKQIENLPEMISSELSTIGVLSPLETQLNSLNAALVEAKSKYSPNNPKIKILEEQIKELQKQSQKGLDTKSASLAVQKSKNLLKEKLSLQLLEMDGKLLGAAKLKEDLKIELANREKLLEGLPKKQLAYSQLLQNKLITEDQLKKLEQNIQAIDLMMRAPNGGIEIYELAQRAGPLSGTLPLGSNLLKIIPVLALLFGALVGAFIAAILEVEDHRICTPKELASFYNLPPLAVLPEMTFFTKRNGEEKTLYYVRNLVEHLEYVCGKTPLNSLTITSSLDNEGKSLVAYYLAKYYQRLGKKVILLDFDYNRNTFVEDLDNPQKPVENFLRGKAELNEIIIPGHPDRIEVGDFDLGLKELIKSDKMTQLIRTLGSTYDLIIIDAPGIIKDDYAINLAELTDKSIFVIGSSKVKKKYIDASLKELEEHGVIPCGAILNRVNPVYIDDVRIRQENKRNWKKFFKDLFSFKD